MKIYTKGTFAYVCYAVTFVCCITISCGKEIPKGRIPNGYIAITFDDASINNWYSNLALMDSLDIKATFYISQYHTLKSEEKKKLFEIQNHGHEIAYHTSNHQDLKILMNSPSGWDKVNREICEDMEMMKRDGFDVTNFAFPYGSHDTELDRRILKKFKTVRALSNRTNYYKSLIPRTGENQVFYAADIDMNSKISDYEINNLISLAREYNNCLILVAHQINNSRAKYQVDTDRLRSISSTAKQFNLSFIPVSKIN